jgi:CubicO group peptidase (beta-lactamase class C family)
MCASSPRFFAATKNLQNYINLNQIVMKVTRLVKTFVLCNLIAMISTNCTNAQYHKKLQKIAENNRLIGMSVAVVCQGQLKDVYHYGISDLERGIGVNNQTMYRIASISKTVTSVALMKLFERGLFALDDDIGKYLGYQVANPNFPDIPITFRMLLTHTSSLTDGPVYDRFLTASYQQNPPPPLMELLTPGGGYYGEKLFATRQPGSYFSYCNLNFGIMGTLIEKLSGQRFDNFVREEILNPMGIQGSFNVADIRQINNLSPLYRNSVATVDNYKGIRPTGRDLASYIPGNNGIIFGPQGGLRISALDLAKFMMMILNQGKYNGTQILESKTIELMHTAQWQYDGTNGDNYNNLFNAWGLGFHLITNSPGGDIVFEGEKMAGHSGNAYGLISGMYYNINQNFGLIFITNGYKGEQSYGAISGSAFYKPEAEVFRLIERHFNRKCMKKKK